jgi:hypothetical protein
MKKEIKLPEHYWYNQWVIVDRENQKLKKELEENQQISDRISSLIVERDDIKKELEDYKKKVIEVIDKQLGETEYTDVPQKIYIDFVNSLKQKLKEKK